MPRKKRRSVIDELFGGSIFGDTESFFESSEGGGYSISMVQTPEGTKVKARVGKNMDAEALQKKLQRQYPNAEIEIDGERRATPLIRELFTKTLKPETEEKEG